MSKFEEIITLHDKLSAELAQGRSVDPSAVRRLIDAALQNSHTIVYIEDRAELRTILRLWASYLSSLREDLPDIDIDTPNRASPSLQVRPQLIGPITDIAVSPYTDTAIAFRSNPLKTLSLQSVSWSSIPSSFWKRKLSACFHNQTLLAQARDERIVQFIPLYFFNGIFVLASVACIRRTGKSLQEVVVDSRLREFPVLKVKKDYHPAVFEAAKRWATMPGVDFEWILRRVVLEAGFTEQQFKAGLQHIGEKTSQEADDRWEIITVGADEAFSLIDAGEHILLSSSFDFNYHSVDGIFIQPYLPRVQVRQVMLLAEEFLRVAHILKGTAKKLITGKASPFDEALIDSCSPLLQGPGRIVYYSNSSAVARTLINCFAPASRSPRRWVQWRDIAIKRLIELVKLHHHEQITVEQVAEERQYLEPLTLRVFPSRNQGKVHL